MTALPASHPLRETLHNEVHARPYEPVAAPEQAHYLALAGSAEVRASEGERLAALCGRLDHAPPAAEASHFSADFGGFRLKWERHAEFSDYTVYRALGAGPYAPERLYGEDPLAALPADWLAALPGSLMVSIHAVVLPEAAFPAGLEAVGAAFAGNLAVGGRIAGGNGTAYTDFMLHEGTSRLLVLNREMGPRQTGRTLQRLFEIEVYRMMALLALPLAQVAGAQAREAETELAQLTQTVAAVLREEEPALLDALTRLAAEIERSVSETSFRFGAARAYHALVRQRIDDLRETRIPGVQTITEFIERRVRPAMDTCESVAARQESLARRVARATALLHTRVDVAREQQNQRLLASLDRRQRIQLRLQETVEGLSIAAITYYLVGLVAYLAKAAKSVGVHVDPELAAGIAIPVVALVVALGVRRIRRIVSKETTPDEARWSA